MSEPNWPDIHKRFVERFSRGEEGSKGGKAFITARSVMERLDGVAGPENWSSTYRTVHEATGVIECTLEIHGVTKCDVGYPNNEIGATTKAGTALGSGEPFKDAYSDALKRAAVHWGIGRYLYLRPGDKQPHESSDEPRQDSGPSFAMNMLTGKIIEPQPANTERDTTIEPADDGWISTTIGELRAYANQSPEHKRAMQAFIRDRLNHPKGLALDQLSEREVLALRVEFVPGSKPRAGAGDAPSEPPLADNEIITTI